ncbi:MAG: UDP-N-acetylmuramoyl-L-alanyl-D-glutamate--2,6-diaminopimelate ligase, partial [Anaeroplasmataceae bacterium]|nr:UDP-N-acetylmuramoyl-L-alanyl-D-glutamate--2,6-diaminopimelate ligase [Anaeroplasmataceae bacterium]
LGGGTPSYLSVENLEKITNSIKKFNLQGNMYLSVETTPVIAANDFGKMKALRELGYNRISMGFQTVSEALLESLGREGSKSIYEKAVENIRKALALLAKAYFHDVSNKLTMIGIVGTNGKTTTSTIGYNFFNSIGRRSMLIGTNGVFYQGYEGKLENTTPDILTIYQYLSLAKRKKIPTVFMEISSISVDQYRIYGLEYDCLIFTNFSQDHLDYHKTLDRYLFCKLIPFIKLSKSAYAILNTDDMASKSFSKFTDAHIISYGVKENADILGTIHSYKESGISFYTKDILFKTKLLGEFNVMNCLSILALCTVFHIPFNKFQDFISRFEPVDGRMNVISYKDQQIWIDYAHTYMATKKVIEEARRLCKGNLHIVLGCGGNREKEKRFMIGTLLNSTDARIILTTDNPRFEDPMAIISDIHSTIEKEVEVIPNRKEAIVAALEGLSSKDYLLVLGKGCEKYMDIQGVKYPYSDLEVIHEWIRNH